MSRFKPQITVITNETRREYQNSYNKKSPYKTIQYPTYRELLKNIEQHLIDNLEAEVHVVRSRRGEWGEWNETWAFEGGEATIIKECWS